MDPRGQSMTASHPTSGTQQHRTSATKEVWMRTTGCRGLSVYLWFMGLQYLTWLQFGSKQKYRASQVSNLSDWLHQFLWWCRCSWWHHHYDPRNSILRDVRQEGAVWWPSSEGKWQLDHTNTRDGIWPNVRYCQHAQHEKAQEPVQVGTVPAPEGLVEVLL